MKFSNILSKFLTMSIYPSGPFELSEALTLAHVLAESASLWRPLPKYL